MDGDPRSKKLVLRPSPPRSERRSSRKGIEARKKPHRGIVLEAAGERASEPFSSGEITEQNELESLLDSRDLERARVESRPWIDLPSGPFNSNISVI